MAEKIEMCKTYKTRGGLSVRVLCIDRDDSLYPVVAIIGDDKTGTEVSSFTADGLYFASEESNDEDLIEHSPWSDVAVDTKIFVSSSNRGCWLPRHFSHYADGKVYAWDMGFTSHSRGGSNCSGWEFAKLAE